MKTIELKCHKDGKLKQPSGVFTIVDDDDYEWAASISWSNCGRGYASNSKKGKLHRLIMKAQRGEEVDHINGNKLDNRKYNLRITNKKGNMENRNKYKNNISGFRGVSWHKYSQSWISQVSHNNKRYSKFFHSKEEAAEWAASKRKEFGFLEGNLT